MNKNSDIALVSVSDIGTTAEYFERSFRRLGAQVIRLPSINAALLATEPDCICIVDPALQKPWHLLRADAVGLGYLIDVHQELSSRLAYARYLDHVFVAQKDYVDMFRALPHPSVHWLPLACEPSVHFVSGLTRNIDLAFVGKRGSPGTERFEVLQAVLTRFATNDVDKFYTPTEMGRIYSSAKIIFNKSINGDLNMRFFEALASGGMLITDNIENGIGEIAEDGKHYISYSSPEDAINKIQYYLEKDNERIKIAEAGQSLVFQSHTYEIRAKSMLEILRTSSGCCAPAKICERGTELEWRTEAMKIQGVQLAEAVAAIDPSQFSIKMALNLGVGVARGLIRPMRQRLQSILASK